MENEEIYILKRIWYVHNTYDPWNKSSTWLMTIMPTFPYIGLKQMFPLVELLLYLSVGFPLHDSDFQGING